MNNKSLIRIVKARQIISDREIPSVEATVVTENGAHGIAVASAGYSVGENEIHFLYDGGEKWDGKGVLNAVRRVNDVIAPALKGVDATNQKEIDEIMITLDGTPNKANLGGNAITSVSAAALKAGANSKGLPLYQHIGGVNACIIPTPAVLSVIGGTRYGGGEKSGGKPSYSFVCYGFNTYSDASYACWQVKRAFTSILHQRFALSFAGRMYNRIIIQPGIVEHDQQLWEIMLEAIKNCGYTDRVGIQVDVAASTYYEKKKDKFIGLFSREDKSREDLINIYRSMVKDYSLVILEDPLNEDDFEGHALLTRDLGIQIVGDDLFATNIERFKHGVEVDACNCLLLKVNQIGTITEAFDTARFAQNNGYGVMPCDSRGEGPDIADYAVGLGTGTIRESGLDFTTNRLLQIEAELGSKARFPGREGLKLANTPERLNRSNKPDI